MNGRPPSTPARRHGFSLVEMMVAMAIGLVVVGAVLALYLASAQSGRHTQALVQLAEDGNAALAAMRTQIALAGYSEVLGVDAHGLQRHAFTPLTGCEGANFADPQASAASLVPPACGASTGGTGSTDAIEVAYQASLVDGPAGARLSNSVLGTARTPLDCLGNTFDPQAAGDPPYYLADSKFYVQQGKLYCHGPGAAAAAPLVENVEDLQIVYGLASPLLPGQVAAYADAPPPGSADWQRVVAVKLCLLVRSASRVLGAQARGAGNYTDCANVPRESTDGYLRRAFSTTVALQNRLP